MLRSVPLRLAGTSAVSSACIGLILIETSTITKKKSTFATHMLSVRRVVNVNTNDVPRNDAMIMGRRSTLVLHIPHDIAYACFGVFMVAVIVNAALRLRRLLGPSWPQHL